MKIVNGTPLIFLLFSFGKFMQLNEPKTIIYLTEKDPYSCFWLLGVLWNPHAKPAVGNHDWNPIWMTFPPFNVMLRYSVFGTIYLSFFFILLTNILKYQQIFIDQSVFFNGTFGEFHFKYSASWKMFSATTNYNSTSIFSLREYGTGLPLWKIGFTALSILISTCTTFMAPGPGLKRSKYFSPYLKFHLYH